MAKVAVATMEVAVKMVEQAAMMEVAVKMVVVAATTEAAVEMVVKGAGKEAKEVLVAQVAQKAEVERGPGLMYPYRSPATRHWSCCRTCTRFRPPHTCPSHKTVRSCRPR